MKSASRLLLAGLFATSFVIGTDVVGIGVLLDAIEAQFNTTVSTAQWVISGYALAFAMAIVAGGRLADTYGRRKLLLIGLVVFGIGAIGGTASTDIGFLVGARVVQGIGAAIAWPCTMGLLFLSVPQEKAGAYIGALLGAVGLGNVTGPIIGGGFSVLAPWGWRLFFAFNLLAAVVAFTFVTLGSDERAEEPLKRERIDYAGILVLSVAFVALLVAFDIATSFGWKSAPVIASLVVAGVGFIVFPWVERKVSEPLLPPRLWRNKAFIAAVLLNGLQIGPAFIAMAFIPQLGQRVWGYSDLKAALLLLPFVIFFASVAPIAGRLYDRLGGRIVIGAGYAVIVASTLWFVLVPPDRGYWVWLVPAMVLMGTACSLTVGPSGTVAVSSVREDEVGLAGGLSFQWHLTSAAITIAVATFIITSTVHTELRHTIEAQGHEVTQQELRTIHGIEHENAQAVLATSHLPPEVRDQLKADVSQGFEDGFRKSFWFATAVGALGLFLVPFLPPRRREPSSNEA